MDMRQYIDEPTWRYVQTIIWDYVACEFMSEWGSGHLAVVCVTNNSVLGNDVWINRGLNKMTNILQTPFNDAFPWKNFFSHLIPISHMLVLKSPLIQLMVLRRTGDKELT